MAPKDESFPIELLWVSRRRTREIVELHEAQQSRLRPMGVKVGTPTIPFVPSLEANFQRAASRTVSDYAVLATKYVKPETGSLQRPNRFIRMTLDYVHMTTFEVPFAWPEGSQQRVSTLFASQWVEGVGRVFVALFGSPHNINPDMEPERYFTGRVPSNANGLYRIIDSMREPDEVQLLQKTLTEKSYENDVDDARRVDLAAEVIYGLHNPLPAQRLEILAEPASLVHNHTLSRTRHGEWPPRPFELVLTGTAIWAGTPSPEPDLATRFDLQDDAPRLWPLLDAHLYEFLDASRRGERPEIPGVCIEGDEPQWRAYASWFVNLGRQIGQSEHEVLAYRRPSKWSPSRYLSRNWQHNGEALVATGQSGFIVSHAERDRAVLVTAVGDAVPVRSQHSELIHWPGGEPDLSQRNEAIYWPGGGEQWLEPRERPKNVGPEELRGVRQAMWLQAAEWIRRAH